MDSEECWDALQKALAPPNGVQFHSEAQNMSVPAATGVQGIDANGCCGVLTGVERVTNVMNTVGTTKGFAQDSHSVRAL